MAQKALFVVSFGTSYDDTREKTIGAAERALAAAFPDHALYTAFTSGMVRRALAARGIGVSGVEDALAQMERDGARELLCQPTHLIRGEEYDKLSALLKEHAGRFDRVRLGLPLLSDYDDIGAVLAAVRAHVEREKDEALVLMGHGTGHFCNTVYAAMDYYAQRAGMRDVCIGTVEAWPDLSAAMNCVRERGYRRAVLTPLMLVAGDHAQNDMTGPGPTSWLSQFRAAGIETRAVVRGLGQYEEIRALYCEHARKAAEHGA